VKLIYEATGKAVAVGDEVLLDAPIRRFTVGFFRKPHKPSSQGHVILYFEGNPRDAQEFYVSVIGARWIEREDREGSGDE
jgi:hypothetical protein